MSFHYKVVPKHYFSYYLFKKTTTNIKDYLPNKILDAEMKLFFNDYSHSEVLENKLFFDLYYRQFDISLPKILMHNHNNSFILNGTQHEIETVAGFESLLKKVFETSPLVQAIIIKKTYQSYGGDKIYKIDRNFRVQGAKDINELYGEIIKAGFLFQESIKQHQELDKLNPSCLNTIRIDTFIDKFGKVEIISAFLRMSISNSYVDNASQGGCYIGINLVSGSLKKTGYTVFRKSGMSLLSCHPVTKTKFENFNLPFFEESKDLVLRAASHFPSLRLIGWDIGIGIDGPILIEGNSWYNARGNDLTSGGYLSNPVFQKIFSEYKNKT